jgi:hypothetical protein
MAEGPRYAPKERYRARGSAGERVAIPDDAATSLDRPVIDVAALQRAQAVAGAVTPPPTPTPHARVRRLVGLVLGAALLVGLALGAALALLGH